MEEEETYQKAVNNVETNNDMLLQAARTGNLTTALNLAETSKADRIHFNVNCKGQQKGNLGWTPLHLAAYFGHLNMIDFLLNENADVNMLNNEGDTALHKAAYTGRTDVVLRLLSSNANVFVKNAIGSTAMDLAKTEDIEKLLQAALESDNLQQEACFLNAVRNGDVPTIKIMLNDKQFSRINCTDVSGNTALHVAAYRGRKEIAIVLLQVGADSTIKNKYGQLAKDLASSPQMKQILDVKPVKHLQKSVSRFEGTLLRRSRLFGWKPNWTILERGVLSFFSNRADATTGVRRRDYKYLDSAKIQSNAKESGMFSVHFSDNTTQTFSVPCALTQTVDRQKWISALEEHSAFSNHYIQQGMILPVSDDDDMGEAVPLSTMQDALKSAEAHQRLLEQQIDTVSTNLENLLKIESNQTLNGNNQLLNTTIQLKDMTDYSKKVAASLNHCMALFAQQEEIRKLQLRQEQEKSRVLEDALHALAKEHHILECSLSAVYKSPSHSPLHLEDTDEFFDAFEGDDDDNTLTPNIESLTDEDAHTLYEVSEPFCSETEQFVSLPRSESNIQVKYKSRYGRVKLPVPMFSKDEFSMWSILKQCIGKELSKITMPVIFNEPLSLLQRIAEYMEYADLLNRANQSSDPIERLQLVAAFATSASASNWERIGKPFNPLLGETYELVRDDGGFRLVCEQVSHHPPISAFHAQSKDFIFYGSVYPKLKFWGKSIEVIPEGVVTVELPGHKEVYTWNNVTCCIHNIIVGKLWLEQYGVMEVVCHQNNMKAVLNFKPAGWFGRDLHRIEGYIYDKQKKKLRFLYGKWTDYLKGSEVSAAEQYFKSHAHLKKSNQNAQHKTDSATAVAGSPAHSSRKVVSKLNNLTRQLTGGGGNASSGGGGGAATGAAGPGGSSSDLPSLSGSAAELDNNEVPKSDSAYSLDIPNSELIWIANPRPQYSPEYYHFTLFAMALNEIKPSMDKTLPSTDSRLRPDIRKLEEGDMSGAAFQKNRLEEKQREVRKRRKKNKEGWDPVWFQLGKHSCVKEDVWLFRSTYWKRDYANSPDIFGNEIAST